MQCFLLVFDTLKLYSILENKLYDQGDDSILVALDPDPSERVAAA